MSVPALVMNCFAPSITHSPPSSRARVRVLPASDPASGSVSPNAASRSPEVRRGSHSCFCSSRPEQVDRLRAERGVRAERDRDRRVDARELLDRDGVGERVRARAAVVLGERDPHPAELAELARRSRTGTTSSGRAPRRPARSRARRSRGRSREAPRALRADRRPRANRTCQPRQLGGRRSRKARSPSCASSLARRSAISSASSPASSGSRAIRFAIRTASGPAARISATTRSTPASRSSASSVNEPDPERPLGVEPLAGDEEGARVTRPDPCDDERRDDGRDDPDLHLAEREPRAARGDDDVAAGEQAAGAAEDVPVHAGDDRRRAAVDRVEQRPPAAARRPASPRDSRRARRASTRGRPPPRTTAPRRAARPPARRRRPPNGRRSARRSARVDRVVLLGTVEREPAEAGPSLLDLRQPRSYSSSSTSTSPRATVSPSPTWTARTVPARGASERHLHLHRLDRRRAGRARRPRRPGRRARGSPSPASAPRSRRRPRRPRAACAGSSRSGGAATGGGRKVEPERPAPERLGQAGGEQRERRVAREEVGGRVAGAERRMRDEPAQERQVRHDASDLGLGERRRAASRSPRPASRRGRSASRSSGRSASRPCRPRRPRGRRAPSPAAGAARSCPLCGRKRPRVLGVQPHLDRVPAAAEPPAASSWPSAIRICSATRSTPGHRLGHRMLDLDPRVQLEEEELAPGDDELGRAGAAVVDRVGEPERRLAELAPELRVDRRATATPRAPSGAGAGSSTHARRGRSP